MARSSTDLRRYGATVPVNAMLTGYLAGVSTLAPFLTLPDELLFRRPAVDAWSAAEVIHHLADAEIFWSILYRRVLVEQEPPMIERWNEDHFCEVLRYRDLPLISAVGTVSAMRHLNVELLASLTPEKWSRTAIHHEQGAMTLRELVLMATSAMSDHLAQARRAVNGSP